MQSLRDGGRGSGGRCSIQIHGGVGVTKDMPLERWYRELRIRRIGEGPSEVQRSSMARDRISGAAPSDLEAA